MLAVRLPKGKVTGNKAPSGRPLPGGGRADWLNWLDAFFCLVFPSPCRACEGPLFSHRSLICGKCWDSIRLIDPPFCHCCGIPFPSAESQSFTSQFLCGTCRTEESSFHQARSVGFYTGALREAIHLFKYSKRQELARHFGGLMLDHFPKEWNPSDIDLLLPIPLHPRRCRERGFNQSLLLARFLAGPLQLKLDARQLSRSRPTLPQSDLPLRQRFENLHGAFALRNPQKIEGKNVLLVDDIYTSGATIQEASRTLLRAGASKVYIYTLARSVLS